MLIHFRNTFYFIFLIVLQGCFDSSEIAKSKKLAESLYLSGKVSSHQIIEKNFSLHYISSASDADLALVFIHGTPGTWRVFAPQLQDARLLRSAQLISIDRPGWGDSAMKKGHMETSLNKQSKLIAPLLKKLRLQNKKVVLVGHSIGATIAPKIAITHPDLVDAVVSLSGDLSEEYFRKPWYNGIASWRLFHAIMPRDVCFASDEVLAMPKNLARLANQWENLDTPFWVVQGGKDSSVDPRNADFAEALVTQNEVKVVFISDAGHLVHLTHADKINGLLLEVVNHVSKQP